MSIYQPRLAKSIWPVIAALAMVIAAAGAVFWRWPAMTDRVAQTAPPPARRQMAAAPTPAPAPPLPVAKPAATAPSFDIVRVGPHGTAVIAGRAEPGAEVTVRDGDQTIGVTRADANGEFVLAPDRRLTAGGRELTLSERTADGQQIRGSDTVVVMVPEPAPTTGVAATPAAPTENMAVAVLIPHDEPASRVLQTPAAGDKTAKLGLNTVDYDDKGEIRFSGSAKPSAPVRVYVDNKPVGDTQTDAAGQWTMTPPESVPPGLHQLRVDQLASNGNVMGRVELPFQRTITPPEGMATGQAVVQPGENLWRIARHTYGFGMRYTVIFLANRDQIRDPNRIYPGQIFSVPTGP